MAVTPTAPAGGGVWAGLDRFERLPGWLEATADPGVAGAALRRHIPELLDCDPWRFRLKGPTWDVLYRARLARPDGPPRVTDLFGLVHEPGTGPLEVAGTGPIGSPGWRLAVPELGLDLTELPADGGLAALPHLLDPAPARTLLEEGIRACAPGYADLRIASARPRMLRCNPGSRATLRYDLTYPPEAAGRGWPAMVVAKTHHGAKGRHAWDAMRVLWDSPLAAGGAVRLAEPLAWVEELKVLVQGPVPVDRTLAQLLRRGIADPDGPAAGELPGALALTAGALAALHRSGLQHGRTRTLEQELDEAAGVADRLAVPVPALAGATGPLVAALTRLAAGGPDGLVPSHRSFRPGQILLSGDGVGVIDFDGFGMAEPAMDVAMFRADLKDTGMLVRSASGVDDEVLAGRLEALADEFTRRYAALVPVSPERVALWEAVDLLTCVLHSWTKVQPRRLVTARLLLERHLVAMGL
jgi:hypothetical protein